MTADDVFAILNKKIKTIADSFGNGSTAPTKTSELTNDSGFVTEDSIPKKVSELENDSNFITNAVNDLANYYLKAETYTRDEVKALISAIPKFSIQPVDILPTEDISTTTVYLVKSGDETDNLYTEYIYVNDAWEYLGKQTVDLSGYALKADIPTKISQLTNDSNFLTEHQDLSDYAKKEYVDSAKNSILLIDTETGTTYALQATNGQIAITEVTSE